MYQKSHRHGGKKTTRGINPTGLMHFLFDVQRSTFDVRRSSLNTLNALVTIHDVHAETFPLLFERQR